MATPAHPWEAQYPSIVAGAAGLQVSNVEDRMVDPAPSSGARLQVVQPGQDNSVCVVMPLQIGGREVHTFSVKLNCLSDR